MSDSVFLKDFDQIDKTDVERLVTQGIPEGRVLDYKRDLPGNSDADGKEFLADISSFANSSGGYLVFGVDEERDANGKATGMPTEAKGLRSTNAGAEIARLENIIRTGVAPRIAGIAAREISGLVNGPAIVFRVPRSWVGPHMVDYKGHSRFYARNNTGKYPMDIGEIRSSFALSEELPERIRRFRQERLTAIRTGETPVRLKTGAKIVIHLLPLSAFSPGARMDVCAEAPKQQVLMRPLYLSANGQRFNFDGFLVPAGEPRDGAFTGYVQIFRTGSVEIVDVGILDGTIPSDLGQPRQFIPSRKFEDAVIDGIERFLEFQKRAEVLPPIVVVISLLGVANFELAASQGRFFGPIDRPDLIVPEVVVQDAVPDVSALLKQPFDAIWQAAGVEGSFNYGKDGIRK